MPNAQQRSRLLLFLGLALAVSLDTGAQLCWRGAVPQHGDMIHTLALTLTNPLFAATVVLMIGQLVNWLMVLSVAELSLAQPITALSYLTVAIGSHWLFAEVMRPWQIAGMVLVLAGVFLVSQSAPAPDTLSPEEPPPDSPNTEER